MGRQNPVGPAPESPRWSAWRVVVNFGVVSLVVDLASNGAQSLYGPLLGQLGATALIVGLVTGLGEALALALRLVSGPWSDVTGRYWTFTIAGYALTAVCVPLLAVTPFLGAAGLLLASVLILGERTGKAVRSPAKTVLLADAAGAVGRGSGFAVHKSLDQVGSLLGPLLVSAVIAVTGVLWPAFAILAVPGAAGVVLLLWIRRRVPDTSVYEAEAPEVPGDHGGGEDGGTPDSDEDGDREGTTPVSRLPRAFYLLAGAVGTSVIGLVGFGVISFHLTDAGIVPLAAVPLVYAGAMGAAVVSALASGYAYDRIGARVLLVLPVLIVLVPGLTLSAQLGAVLAGALVWGMATGIEESTVKALIADIVPSGHRGTAYGVFAAFEGAAFLLGGALAGLLYNQVGALVAIIGILQAVALLLMIAALRAQRRTAKM